MGCGPRPFFFSLILALLAPLCHGEARYGLRRKVLHTSRNVEADAGPDFKKLLSEANEEWDKGDLECFSKMEASQALQHGVQTHLEQLERSLQAAAAAEVQLKAQQGTLYGKAVSIDKHREHLLWLCGRLDRDRQSELEVLTEGDALGNEVMTTAAKMQGDFVAKVAALQGSLYDQKARLLQPSKACDSEILKEETELNVTRAGIKDMDRQLKALEESRASINNNSLALAAKLANATALQDALRAECKKSNIVMETKMRELQRQRGTKNGGTVATDCEVSAWRHGECSKKCKGGMKSLTREVVRNAAGGGAACPKLSTTMACNTQACEVTCKLGAWSEWTQCSKVCGGGHRLRNRTVVAPQPAEEAGQAQALLRDTFTFLQGFKSDPVVHSVQESSASAELAMFDNDESAACGLSHDVEICNTNECGSDCTFGEWGAWGHCTKGCGGGKRGRRREIIPAEHSTATDAICNGWDDEFSSCKSQQCPASNGLSCAARQDIMVMVDATELVSAGDFAMQKTFVKELLTSRISLNRAQRALAGLVFFGSAQPGVFPPTDSIPALKARLDGATLGSGGQNFDKGLDAALSQGFLGWSARKDAPRTLLVLLQGKPDSAVKALEQTQKMKEAGVRVVLVVVDKEGSCALNKHILEQLASEPAADNLFFFKSYEALRDKLVDQTVNLCPSLEGEVLPTKYLPLPAAPAARRLLNGTFLP